ncbi:MAG: DUF6879 family protein, partial [Streptosporangiaceae bacterium]
MGRRITDLDSPEFAALFTSFRYTAYRLEALQHYGVGYEDESFRAFASGSPGPGWRKSYGITPHGGSCTFHVLNSTWASAQCP